MVNREWWEKAQRLKSKSKSRGAWVRGSTFYVQSRMVTGTSSPHVARNSNQSTVSAAYPCLNSREHPLQQADNMFGAWVGALYTLLVLREGVEARDRDGYVRRLCCRVEEKAQRR